MLSAAFKKAFSGLHRDDLNQPAMRSNNRKLSDRRRSEYRPAEVAADDDDEANRSAYTHRGNCRNYIGRNPSDSPSPTSGLARQRRYNKQGGRTASYRRLEQEDGDSGRGFYGDQPRHQAVIHSRPKYGPGDIEVWSKKSPTRDEEVDDEYVDDPPMRRSRRTSSSQSGSAGLRDWLSWRCFINQNLAHTVLSARVAVGGAVRTVCAEPDFGHQVVRHILDEYADGDQKPPTSLHQNDYLMFGVPRARLRPEAAAVSALLAATADVDGAALKDDSRRQQEIEKQRQLQQQQQLQRQLEELEKLKNQPRPLLKAKASVTTHIPASFTIQRCIAERVKAADSSCLPSIRWRKTKRPKLNKSKTEVSSEPDYLPSRYLKMAEEAQSRDGSGRKTSSEPDDDRIYLYRNRRSGSPPWGNVVRSRNKLALPPDSSFLVRSRSQSTYWSTSSMTLSMTSSSSREMSSSYSDNSSIYSLPTKVPPYKGNRRQPSNNKYKRR